MPEDAPGGGRPVPPNVTFQIVRFSRRIAIRSSSCRIERLSADAVTPNCTEAARKTAFREVSDALAARTTYVDQVKAQQRLVDATADSVRLSTMLFRAGVDNYLPVLTAEQTLYPAQTVLSLKLAQLANFVTLYKALGGGWNEHTVAITSLSPSL